MRYRATVAYDGTDYQGWQSQAGRGPSVQETLERGFSTVLREPVRVAGAGRTDAGVHACGQVIAFDVSAPIDAPDRVLRSINGVLPRDIAVRDLTAVHADFDPRRHAVQRAYRYRIWAAPVRSPFVERTAWHVPEPLDVAAMGEAAGALVGVHDFASFQAADNVPRPSVRQVEASTVARAGDLVLFRIVANAFVRHMVRNVVGQLVEVGRGRFPAGGMTELLAARDRTRAAPTAPPHGLFLEWVRYR
jgi:tRNA pseudouridine38-40 synthase